MWILLKQQNTEKQKAIRKGNPGGYTYSTGRNIIGTLWIFFVSSNSFQHRIRHHVVQKLNLKYVLSYIHKFMLHQNIVIYIFI